MSTTPTTFQHRHAPSRALLVLAGVVVLAAVVVALIAGGVFDGSSGTLVGSGVPATEEREVDSFAGVELAGTTAVTIQVGGPQSVVVSADENLLDTVTTQVSSGRLVIGTDGSFTTASPMTVDVTVPSLEGLTLSDTGSITADGIRASELTVSLAGSGLVQASGRVESLDVTLAGSGDAELGGLEARTVRAVLSGTGRIVVHASESLDASVPGTGSITYLGGPVAVTESVTGTGTIASG
jgi:Putative auto-transporter adhesin, head GIN domain